ncbi:MAG: molecular chaperone TorD family protein [Deinococcales bacterium]
MTDAGAPKGERRRARAGSARAGSAQAGSAQAGSAERAGYLRLLSELLAREPGPDLLALAATVPSLRAHATPEAAARYTHVFVLNAYPFASVFVEPDASIDGAWAGFTRGVLAALGLEPEPGVAADHAAVLLDALALLLQREAEAGPAELDAERARHAQRILLAEHLLPWLPSFLHTVERVDGGLYRAAAGLARQTLVPLAGALFDAAPAPAAAGASAAAPHHEEEGSDTILDHLTVPARSGLFLCRADLTRLGAELDLPVRFGGRRFMLESLVAAAVQQASADPLTQGLLRLARQQRAVLRGWSTDLPLLEALWRPWTRRIDVSLAGLGGCTFGTKGSDYDAPEQVTCGRAETP